MGQNRTKSQIEKIENASVARILHRIIGELVCQIKTRQHEIDALEERLNLAQEELDRILQKI